MQDCFTRIDAKFGESVSPIARSTERAVRAVGTVSVHKVVSAPVLNSEADVRPDQAGSMSVFANIEHFPCANLMQREIG
jgi:hypothetical protein